MARQLVVLLYGVKPYRKALIRNSRIVLLYRKKESNSIQSIESVMATTPVKVYGPPISTAVSRVLACLLEKGVDYQLISVNMSKGEHKKPDYLKIQVAIISRISLYSFSLNISFSFSFS